MEKPINQRIKFLLDALSLSARDFSRAVGVPDNNTQNYLEPRFAQPKADYLEKIMLHFGSINPAWLLTGQGEPFLSDPAGSISQTGKINQAGSKNKQIVKGNKGGIVGGSIGKAEQTNIVLSECERERDAYKAEVEFLRQQLSMKDQLIAAKEEMLSLLRSQFNRPN
ncbi:hypothetical protein [Hymenobacter convexus]|uniref:hypothetical protein n=1 Tax=Hymenobacter sp. CA1UV-4 TaxID=3063782 RepID=UPI0027140D7C|nr:hypothetical protein [Hymenobacter sp. CA1UV-4]MDO7853184.1 hypothetical protein [Hymenobacter sp. CA1UV-4]